MAEVRILPMSLMLLTCLLGGFFAAGPHLNWKIMGLVLLNAFCFLYTAHLNDTYWDIRKGEYEEGRKLHSVRFREDGYLPRWGFGYEIPNAPILPKHYYLAAMALSAITGVSIMLHISTLIGWLYSALALVGLLLALTYSAGLDRIPALGDTMWEIGVLFALYCGYYSQRQALDPFIVSASVPLFISLISIKALDSLPDTIVDNKQSKVTLTVFLYRKGLSLKAIRHICYLPFYIAFLTLYFTLPPNLKLGALAVVLSFIAQQAALHNDEEGRKSIVLASFTILAFIVVALTVIAGLATLPSI
ncbi:UbiA family prenyltransferase [Candidatus Bathyarchaeota archaeon]|nr:UbiA family prenyltransferase [Candidatus Bathyarchaeota archaeon]